MVVLGYSKWGNFKKVIDKAKIVCSISNNNIFEYFVNVGKMVLMPSGAKPKIIEDYHLSRWHSIYLKAVRQTIEKIGGTILEKLPIPEKLIKELEKEEINKIINKLG